MSEDEDKPHAIMISQAPTDPKEKEAWNYRMMRIQIAMWVDEGATCAYCGHTYTSVDDFIRCNPNQGSGPGMTFVCSGCWGEYKKQ